MLQRVGLDGRRRVVQCVRVVCGLASQRARVGQRSGSAVTEKPGERRHNFIILMKCPPPKFIITVSKLPTIGTNYNKELGALFLVKSGCLD